MVTKPQIKIIRLRTRVKPCTESKIFLNTLDVFWPRSTLSIFASSFSILCRNSKELFNLCKTSLVYMLTVAKRLTEWLFSSGEFGSFWLLLRRGSWGARAQQNLSPPHGKYFCVVKRSENHSLHYAGLKHKKMMMIQVYEIISIQFSFHFNFGRNDRSIADVLTLHLKTEFIWLVVYKTFIMAPKQKKMEKLL